jgi:hypothetical protein
MKKIFVTLFILLGFYSVSHAQRRGDFQFGVTVGGNLSYIENDSYYDSNVLGGFNAGLSADYYFSRALKPGTTRKVMPAVLYMTTRETTLPTM